MSEWEDMKKSLKSTKGWDQLPHGLHLGIDMILATGDKELEALQSINAELYEALKLCISHLQKYADADEAAQMEGGGALTNPQGFIAPVLTISGKAINKAEGKS